MIEQERRLAPAEPSRRAPGDSDGVARRWVPPVLTREEVAAVDRRLIELRQSSQFWDTPRPEPGQAFAAAAVRADRELCGGRA
ncbi:hypothetical protein ABT215_44205, partial [Streptomyces sp900105755]